uniref:non-specific serine/threonine protein kinase n=1 Tax=Anopheles epiroticus TaxID=199890 RepID=A0A182PMA1_9DIPT
VALGRRIGLYRFCGDIGRGNFSRVKLAVHQLTKDKVAIKVVDTSRLDAKALRMLSREVSTLECVYHPFILRLFEVIETLGKIHLISEWVQGGELYNRITEVGPLKEPHAALLFQQLLLAVKHLGEFVISTSLSVPCCRVIRKSSVSDLSACICLTFLRFLERILVHTPSRRPTIEQLLDCQWFRYAQDHAGRLGRSNQNQTTIGQIRNPNNVPRRRRKKLFWFFAPRDRLSSPESNTSSRDNNLSAANNNQHRHHHHHHQHNQQRHQPMSSSTKSSSSRDERLANPPEIPNLRTIACSTKRAASVLEENYLHPLKPDPAVAPSGADTAFGTEHHLHHSHYIKDLSNDVSNNNNVNSNANGTSTYTNQLPSTDSDPASGANGSHKETAGSQERKSRRFSFGRSLKKRIGPMEMVSAESLTGLDGGSRPNRAMDLREKLHRTIDDEHGRFVMYPTTAVSSEGNRHLHPLEAETRRLMKALGITGDMIARAVTNGPRSDIIGVYRIIMHRLQREQTNARLASTNGGAYEFLELKSINGTTTSGCSSGRSGPKGDAGRSTVNSRRHIDQNRGRICAIL